MVRRIPTPTDIVRAVIGTVWGWHDVSVDGWEFLRCLLLWIYAFCIFFLGMYLNCVKGVPWHAPLMLLCYIHPAYWLGTAVIWFVQHVGPWLWTNLW